MKPDDYRLFPLPVLIVSSKNGRILDVNSPAEKLGFRRQDSFFDMLADRTVLLPFVKKSAEPLHGKCMLTVNGRICHASIDAALTELGGQAVYLIAVTNLTPAARLDEKELVAQLCGAYAGGDTKAFLRIAARGTGAFCAALYEKRDGRYRLADEWREQRSVSVPLLSADAEKDWKREERRLCGVKRAADALSAPYQKAHGTKGLAVCFFAELPGPGQRDKLGTLAGVYALLSPDSPENGLAAVRRGLDAISQGFAVWDADTKELLYENRAFRESFGSGSAGLLLARLGAAAEKAGVFEAGHAGRSLSVVQAKTRLGRRALMATAVSDVTRYKKAEDRLEMLAKTDMLTGLNNRRAGLEIFDAAYVRCRKEKKPITVCFADIDGLKRVNDTYGHGVGDNMIRAVAALLKKHADGQGEVCRLGGDEFLIILPGATKAQAMLLCSRIEQAIEKTFVSPQSRITMSFGFKEAEYDTNESVLTLISVADAEMYMRKREKA